MTGVQTCALPILGGGVGGGVGGVVRGGVGGGVGGGGGGVAGGVAGDGVGGGAGGDGVFNLVGFFRILARIPNSSRCTISKNHYERRWNNHNTRFFKSSCNVSSFYSGNNLIRLNR